MAVTEQKIQEWAIAPSRDNDLSANSYWIIRGLLEEKFGSSIDIFLQGSYANSTNIKRDSDIDIVLCYKDTYFHDISNLSEDQKRLFHQNTSPAKYHFTDFKNDVEVYLTSKFGSLAKRKDKCIKIQGEGKRVDVDVVPCFIHKRFSGPNNVMAEGIQFISDRGESIISFPKQHKKNGERKNNDTNTTYKSIVRILKNCKRVLIQDNVIDDKLISSFFVECLVWNIENSYFKSIGKQSVNSIIQKMYSDMDSVTVKYAEVCDLFRLFPRSSITKRDVKAFLEKAYTLINN